MTQQMRSSTKLKGNQRLFCPDLQRLLLVLRLLIISPTLLHCMAVITNYFNGTTYVYLLLCQSTHTSEKFKGITLEVIMKNSITKHFHGSTNWVSYEVEYKWSKHSYIQGLCKNLDY